MQLTEITARQFKNKLKNPVRARHLEQLATIRAGLRQGGFKMQKVYLAKQSKPFATKVRFEVPLGHEERLGIREAMHNARAIVENSLPNDAMLDDMIQIVDKKGESFLSFILWFDIKEMA